MSTVATIEREPVSDTGLDSVRGPASKNPLMDKTLSPDERLSRGIEFVDTQLEELGEILEGTSDAGMQRELAQQIVQLAELRLGLEVEGLACFDALEVQEAVEAYMSFEPPTGEPVSVPPELEILNRSHAPEVVELLAGTDGLASENLLRRQIALRLCTGRKEEQLTSEVIATARSIRFDSPERVEAAVALAHIEDSQAREVLQELLRKLDSSDLREVVKHISDAQHGEAVLSFGLSGLKGKEVQTAALAALKPGDGGILAENLPSLLGISRRDRIVSADAIKTAARIWDASLKEAFSSDDFDTDWLPYAGSAIPDASFEIAREIATTLEPKVHARIGMKRVVLEDELSLLAFNPTLQNVEILKDLTDGRNLNTETAAMSALSAAAGVLRRIGDPNEVAKESKLEKLFSRALRSRSPFSHRMAGVESRSARIPSHRRTLIRHLFKEEDPRVAEAICEKLLPFEPKEVGRVRGALEKRGHHTLKNTVFAEQEELARATSGEEA